MSNFLHLDIAFNLYVWTTSEFLRGCEKGGRFRRTKEFTSTTFFEVNFEKWIAVGMHGSAILTKNTF